MKKHCSFLKNLFLLTMLALLLMLGACNLGMSGDGDLATSQEKLNEVKECFSCHFFGFIYSEVGKLANELYPVVCKFALSLLAILLFGWILIHVLKLITSLREPNIKQFYVELFQVLLKSMFVAIFIATKERVLYLVDHILEPIASMIISIGTDILDTSWTSVVPVEAYFTGDLQSIPGFSADLGMQLENLIYRIQVALNGGHTMGLLLFFNEEHDLVNTILGMIVLFVFMLLRLFYPLYLIDGLIRLAFVLVMLPVFLVCWCFKATAGYLKKAFSIFLGAFLQITLGCVFIALAVAVFEGFISLKNMQYMRDPRVASSDAYAMIDAGRMSVSFLSFVFLAFYIYNLSKQINKFTSFFTEAPGHSLLGAWFARLKAAAIAATELVVATVAYLAGFGAVGNVAAEHAMENMKKFAKGNEE